MPDAMNVDLFTIVERDGAQIELLVEADVSGAEHDVGIMSPQVDDVRATRLDNKQPFELTQEEQDRLSEVLGIKFEEMHQDDDL